MTTLVRKQLWSSENDAYKARQFHRAADHYLTRTDDHVKFVSQSKASSVELTIPQNLACGALGRAAQIVAVFPVDTVKTRMQSSALAVNIAAGQSTSPRFGPFGKAVGQGRFYSGVGVTLIGQVPYAMLTFGLYETIRSRLNKSYPKIPDWLRIMIAASIGDAVGSLWLTPSEVIKSKTQTGLYPSPWSTIQAIGSSGPGAFYQGYAAALARDVPFRAIQMFLYEQCRRTYINRFASDRPDNISALENLLIGAVSGSVTAFLTNPVDVIRTRVMSQPVGAQALYRNAFDCIVKTLSKEGLPALLKGAGPRTFMVGPASAIFFLTYETTKKFFRRRGSQSSLVASSSRPHVSPRRPQAHFIVHN